MFFFRLRRFLSRARNFFVNFVNRRGEATRSTEKDQTDQTKSCGRVHVDLMKPSSRDDERFARLGIDEFCPGRLTAHVDEDARSRIKWIVNEAGFLGHRFRSGNPFNGLWDGG